VWHNFITTIVNYNYLKKMTGLWCACRVNKYVELYHKHFGYSYTLSTSKAFRRQLIACPALSRPASISQSSYKRTQTAKVDCLGLKVCGHWQWVYTFSKWTGWISQWLCHDTVVNTGMHIIGLNIAYKCCYCYPLLAYRFIIRQNSGRCRVFR